MQNRILVNVFLFFTVVLLYSCTDEISPARLSVDITEITLDPDINEVTFTILNEGTEGLTWDITQSVSWLTCSETSGSLLGNSSLEIQAFVDRDKLNHGSESNLNGLIDFNGIIFINSNGGSTGINIIAYQPQARIYYLRTNSFSEPSAIYSATINGNNEKIVSYENYSRLRLSRDGLKIVASKYNETESKTTIVSMNIDGSSLVTLHDEDNSNDYPSWSPDGSEIIFIKSSNLNRAIFKMNADGSNIQQITSSADGNFTSPIFSPNGDKIIAVRSHTQIVSLNSDGSDIQQLTNDEDFSHHDPDISGDGKKIIFTGNRNGSGTYIMDFDGTNIQLLANRSYAARFDNSGKILMVYREDPAIIVHRSISTMNQYGENIEDTGYFTNISASGMIDW